MTSKIKRLKTKFSKITNKSLFLTKNNFFKIKLKTKKMITVVIVAVLFRYSYLSAPIESNKNLNSVESINQEKLISYFNQKNSNNWQNLTKTTNKIVQTGFGNLIIFSSDSLSNLEPVQVILNISGGDQPNIELENQENLKKQQKCEFGKIKYLSDLKDQEQKFKTRPLEFSFAENFKLNNEKHLFPFFWEFDIQLTSIKIKDSTIFTFRIRKLSNSEIQIQQNYLKQANCQLPLHLRSQNLDELKKSYDGQFSFNLNSNLDFLYKDHYSRWIFDYVSQKHQAFKSKSALFDQWKLKYINCNSDLIFMRDEPSARILIKKNSECFSLSSRIQFLQKLKKIEKQELIIIPQSRVALLRKVKRRIDPSISFEKQINKELGIQTLGDLDN